MEYQLEIEVTAFGRFGKATRRVVFSETGPDWMAIQARAEAWADCHPHGGFVTLHLAQRGGPEGPWEHGYSKSLPRVGRGAAA